MAETAHDEVFCTSCGEPIKDEAEVCPECEVRQKASDVTDGDPAVVDPSAFQSRALGVQILVSVVTLLFYWFYWIHITHKQLARGTEAEFDPTLRTLGIFVPFYNLVVMWRTCQDAEAVTDQDGAVLFLFWLVLAPMFWYLVQSGINEIARRGSGGAA